MRGSGDVVGRTVGGVVVVENWGPLLLSDGDGSWRLPNLDKFEFRSFSSALARRLHRLAHASVLVRWRNGFHSAVLPATAATAWIADAACADAVDTIREQ